MPAASALDVQFKEFRDEKATYYAEVIRDSLLTNLDL